MEENQQINMKLPNETILKKGNRIFKWQIILILIPLVLLIPVLLLSFHGLGEGMSWVVALFSIIVLPKILILIGVVLLFLCINGIVIYIKSQRIGANNGKLLASSIVIMILITLAIILQIKSEANFRKEQLNDPTSSVNTIVMHNISVDAFKEMCVKENGEYRGGYNQGEANESQMCWTKVKTYVHINNQ